MKKLVSIPVQAACLMLTLQAAPLCFGTPAASAQESVLESESELVVPALVELATWCHKNSLYGKRSEVYEAILHFDPDHSRARRGLKHSKVKGMWAPPAKPYRPQNKNDEALAKYPAQRVELLRPYCRAVLELLGERGPWEDGVQALLHKALLASPDDPELRALLGEVRIGEEWILEETARASLRRDQLDAIWRDALERSRTRIEETRIRSSEARLGVGWRVAVESEGVRVLGTGTLEEVLRAAEIQGAADDFFRALFRRRARHTGRTTLYLLAEGGQSQLLAAYPGLSEDQREFFLQLSGSELPGGFRIAQWGRDEAQRLDAVTRHSIDDLLHSSFGFDTDAGWIWEGVGGYLTWKMTGTRLTWRVRSTAPRATDSDAIGRDELFEIRPEHWLLLGREVLARGGWLDIASLTDRFHDDMNALDLLAAHALAAYLIEGRVELPEVLHRVGRGESSLDALTGALAMEVPELEWRLRRWLEERALPGEMAMTELQASVSVDADPLLASAEAKNLEAHPAAEAAAAEMFNQAVRQVLLK